MPPMSNAMGGSPATGAASASKGKTGSVSTNGMKKNNTGGAGKSGAGGPGGGQAKPGAGGGAGNKGAGKPKPDYSSQKFDDEMKQEDESSKSLNPQDLNVKNQHDTAMKDLIDLQNSKSC